MPTRSIEYHRHNLADPRLGVLEAVKDVLEGVFLTTGSRVARFEQMFASLFRYKDVEAISVTAGTHALHLALVALGIGPGDEVITTPMTFVATTEAILYTGAKPVFVDVEPETGNIDVQMIERAITHRTKAILPVHLYGNMVDMRFIRTLADHYRLRVIEDAAHCIEGSRAGVRPGELSDAACFSFQALKTLTSGEGGAIVTRHPSLAERLRQMRNHGMTRGAFAQRSNYQHPDISELGFKYGMSELHAALLLAQLPMMEEWHQTRETITALYRNRFSDLPLMVPVTQAEVQSAYYMFPIFVSSPVSVSNTELGEMRDRILADVREQGVGATVQYLPVHAYSYFSRVLGMRMGMFPHAERIGASVIALPLYPALTLDDIEYVSDSLEHALVRARQSR